MERLQEVVQADNMNAVSCVCQSSWGTVLPTLSALDVWKWAAAIGMYLLGTNDHKIARTHLSSV